MLEAAQGLQPALDIAYSYLNRREHTESETRRQLLRQGIDERGACHAIATLKEQGVLDDARYARAFAEDKRELQEWGSERIRKELLARGIDREVVQETLSAESHEAELQRAVEVLDRRVGAPAGDQRSHERALGLLVRRGYDPELAIEAIARHRNH